MPKRTYRTYQALILASLGLFLLSRLWSGAFLDYINPRLVIPLLLAGFVFLILAQVSLAARRNAEEAPEGSPAVEGMADPGAGWRLFLMALPVILGIVISARPLSAGMAADRAVSPAGTLSAGNGPGDGTSLDSAGLTVLGWTQVFNSGADITPLIGKEADVIGFVARDPSLGTNRFQVMRYVVACCAADAQAVGMPVEWPKADSLAENSWVRVRGAVQLLDEAGQKLPLIVASRVDPIQPPDFALSFPLKCSLNVLIASCGPSWRWSWLPPGASCCSGICWAPG